MILSTIQVLHDSMTSSCVYIYIYAYLYTVPLRETYSPQPLTDQPMAAHKQICLNRLRKQIGVINHLFRTFVSTFDNTPSSA